MFFSAEDASERAMELIQSLRGIDGVGQTD